MLDKSALTDDAELEDGNLVVYGVQLSSDCPLIGKTVSENILCECAQEFRPIAIHRQNKTSLTGFDLSLRIRDIIYFIGKKTSIEKAMKLCGKKKREIKKIMILGGSRIGQLTAKKLMLKYDVTLMEKDPEKCFKLTETLKECLIVNVYGRDVSGLEEEGLDSMDAFVAVTSDSETNIISTLVAKSRHVKKNTSQVENLDYIHLSQDIGIDTLINKKMVAVSSILNMFIKGKLMLSLIYIV